MVNYYNLFRGVAIEDANSPHGLKLLIEDYPYASDGLEIWSAIKTWVVDYCSFYYKDDKMVSNDSELQSWWKELREKGHEDKKNEHWWPKMQSLQDLIDSCTIIIWISSALHASVNFGQYHYGGFFPNRPLTSTRFLPEEGSIEYEELRSDPEKAFMKTIQVDLSSVALTEISSRHSSDEVYLGERNSKEWTLDEQPLQSFEKFKKKLVEIENMFMKRNQDPKLKNRVGPVNLPYTLMFPTSTEGLTGRGIPNSISM